MTLLDKRSVVLRRAPALPSGPLPIPEMDHAEDHRPTPRTATDVYRPHPRKITWRGASALAIGGSNQSIFLIAALLAAQGSAAIPLLAIGLLLSYLATPGWIELSCMFPDRVGGIAASCAEAFRPYGSVLANLTGVCYWWGWVPTCGITALFSADALHDWFLPHVSVKLLGITLVLLFMGVNLCGLKWAVRLAVPVAVIAFALALGTGLIPIFAGTVDWHRALDFHLIGAFDGTFGKLTSAMAGLYLIGFAAPAFEAAACHIGEMKAPDSDQPRAMWCSGAMASVYFVLIPVVWLGLFGSATLQGELTSVLGPSFAPLFGAGAKACACAFIAFNMFSGTIQPLSGASRTLSQLSEDGLLPRSLGYRQPRTDAPIVAIVITAAASIAFQFGGKGFENDFIAAANLTYLIGIGAPSIAVWLLRRHEPDRPRPYRAKTISIRLGVAAAVVWLLTTTLGFEQFGLPIVIFGLALAYSGSLAYVWRLSSDRRRDRRPRQWRSIHAKLTGAMLAVLILDGFGYLLAVNHVTSSDATLITGLKDIFVTVGLLTIGVGLVLPGMVAHTAGQVSGAARELASVTLAELTSAMEAMAAGDLDHTHVTVDIHPIEVRSKDEIGEMATNVNVMLREAAVAASALDVASEELRVHRDELERLVTERTDALIEARQEIEETEFQRQQDKALMTERDRIARDLHDTVIQRLFAVGLSLQSTKEMRDPDMATRHIEVAIEGLDATVSELRTAIYELEESNTSGKFRSSLMELTRELAPVLGFSPAVTFSGPVDLTIGPSLTAEILSVVRESLTNVAKHAHATAVDLAVAVTDVLVLVVIDDGVGLPDGFASDRTGGYGLGMGNMSARAEALGGELRVERPDGGGTCIVWTVPLEGADSN